MESNAELHRQYQDKIRELQAARQRVIQLEKEVKELDEKLYPPFYKSLGEGGLFKE